MKLLPKQSVLKMLMLSLATLRHPEQQHGVLRRPHLEGVSRVIPVGVCKGHHQRMGIPDKPEPQVAHRLPPSSRTMRTRSASGSR